MLSLQMKSGDYVTIGNQVVVQVFKESGPQFRVSIKAPREVPIVRGKVLERDGEQRPEGLLDRKPNVRRPIRNAMRNIFRKSKKGGRIIMTGRRFAPESYINWAKYWIIRTTN